jgi:AraC-like DNA-binding protein
MDNPIKKRSGELSHDSIVTLAGWFQFAPGTRFLHRQVESRMLVWCQKGRCSAQVNESRIEFTPGHWALLPWKHRVQYDVDARQAVFMGGIHLIPRHKLGVPVVFHVAHSAKDALADLPERRDDLWPGLQGLVQGHFEETDRLAMLASYVVEKFHSGAPEEVTMRDLARLLIGELQMIQGSPSGARPLPGVVRRLQKYIDTHIGEEITVEALAQLAGCSGSSLHRLFRDYTGLSPGGYMAHLRVEKASFLLRTTLLSIQDVGFKAGFPDPFYFSRFFKQKTGLSPTAYQRSRRFFG